MILSCGARAGPPSDGARAPDWEEIAVSAALMLGAKNVVYTMFFLEEVSFYANHAV